MKQWDIYCIGPVRPECLVCGCHNSRCPLVSALYKFHCSRLYLGESQQQAETGPVPPGDDRGCRQPCLHVRHPGTVQLSAQGSGINRTVAPNVLEQPEASCFRYEPKISIIPGIT